MERKKTLVLGATDNPARYAYVAANRLVDAGYEIVNIGIKKGEVAGVPIQTAADMPTNIHTVTLYIGPRRQPQYYDYILQMNPKRVIFNPGTENPELKALIEQQGIEAVDACTLVLLSTGQY